MSEAVGGCLLQGAGSLFLIFFFQAEDGIRDDLVTGVQTCALPISPTGASWLNLVERWFGLLTAQQLRRGVFRSIRNLETTIRHYIDIHNEEPKPFIWTKTADEILDSVARFCQRTLGTPH